MANRPSCQVGTLVVRLFRSKKRGGRAVAYTALFAFGDSLSDAGNDWIVDGHTDPVSPYYQGHFSNGLTWVEDLSNMLGLGMLKPSRASAWCMDQRCERNDPNPGAGVRRCGHSSDVPAPTTIQRMAATSTSVARRTSIRERRPSPSTCFHADCRLDLCAPTVARGFLPGRAALLGDALEMTVALCRRDFSRFARHRRAARRHNYRRFRMTVGDCGVNAILIVGSVSGERGQ